MIDMKSIGEEIVQAQFSSEYQKLLVNIIYTNNVLADKVSSLLKDFDITRQQFNVLRILRGQHPKPVSQNTIKERLLDKMSDTSRLMERLLVKRLIERSANASDRRVANIKITQAGLDLLQKIDPLMHEFEKTMNNLNAQEAEQPHFLLDKLRNA